MEEVVVTANRRTERLQDVAQSVAVVGSADLIQTQTLDLQDLSGRVAGLNLSSNGVQTRIVLRGLNSGAESANVATVIDDIPLSFSAANANGGILSNDFGTYDLQQVEVLSGPQGTLYGATAEGGLISYVTNKPDYTAFRAGVEAGSYSLAHADSAGYSGKGYVNFPLFSGDAGIRATGFYESTPGWIGNEILKESHVNSKERDGGRLQFQWSATGDLMIRATAMIQNLIAGADDNLLMYGKSQPANQFGLPFGYNIGAYSDSHYDTRTDLYALNVSYDLHGAKLQSITSYGNINNHYVNDATAEAGALGPGTTIAYFQYHDLKKINQELRLTSEPGSTLLGRRFDWQAGAFYTRESIRYQQNLYGFLNGVLAPPPLNDVADDNIPVIYTDAAIFLDGTYHLTPTFDVEAGVRSGRNEERSSVHEGGLLFAPFDHTPPSVSETVTTYSFAPRYHFTPDVMSYFRIASGYRPGGQQIPVVGQPASVPTSFTSDSTVNYEIGLKGSFLNKALTADLAAFYIDWRRIQIQEFIVVNGTQFSITGNAGTAKSEGIEWNFEWLAAPGLRFDLVGAYTKAELTQDASSLLAFKGNKLAYVPDLTSTLSVNYEWNAVMDWRAFVGADVEYVGTRYSDFPYHVRLPTYNTYGLQAGMRRGGYSVELYGKNLSDSRGITSYTPTGFLVPYGGGTFIRPRVVGIRFAADF